MALRLRQQGKDNGDLLTGKQVEDLAGEALHMMVFRIMQMNEQLRTVLHRGIVPPTVLADWYFAPPGDLVRHTQQIIACNESVRSLVEKYVPQDSVVTSTDASQKNEEIHDGNQPSSKTMYPGPLSLKNSSEHPIQPLRHPLARQ